MIGYTAGPGYDMVTGLGSVDAHRLARAWTELAPTPTSLRIDASGWTEGSSVKLSASVSSNDSAALTGAPRRYSTVTVFARFRGWSTSVPFRSAT
jgi:hypothetical protein